MRTPIIASIAVLTCSATAPATDLTLHLNSNQPVTRQTVQYRCDAQGEAMGLPAGPFSVEYVNGAGNSLAILPVHGASLVFSNVYAGSGARYAALDYIWWDAAGRSTSFSSDSIAGKMRSDCHRVAAK